MTGDFLSLIFMWLLPLTASTTVTSAPNHTFTAATTAEVGSTVVPQQLTTWEASTLNTPSKVSARITTQPVTQKMTNPSTKGLQETTGTTMSKTFLPDPQSTAGLTSSRSPQLNSSTVQSMTTTRLKITTATSQVTSRAGIPTTTGSAVSKETNNKTQHPSTRPTQSTKKTFMTSIIPVVNKSTATPKTSKTTTKTPSVLKKDKDRQPKDNESQNGAASSKAVAGIIGTILTLMFIGFLVIYMKKRKLHKQQITTTEWAGPSPFLQDASDNGQVTLRSSNRVSLSSFLPQRLSKRLSLLQETDEELTEMTPGTTFGDKHQGTTFGQEMDVMEVQETNGTAVVVPEIKSKGNDPDSQETSVSSSQTNVSVSTNNNSEVANLNQEQPENPPTSPGAAENSATE